MVIRKMERDDIAACADILCTVYNNEMWQCRWTDRTATECLTDFLRERSSWDMCWRMGAKTSGVYLPTKKYGGTTAKSLSRKCS